MQRGPGRLRRVDRCRVGEPLRGFATRHGSHQDRAPGLSPSRRERCDRGGCSAAPAPSSVLLARRTFGRPPVPARRSEATVHPSRGDERDRTVDLLLAKYTYDRPKGRSEHRRVFAGDPPFVMFSLVSRCSNVRPDVRSYAHVSISARLSESDTVPPMATSVATSNSAFDLTPAGTRSAAATASDARPDAAANESPAVVNTYPPCDSIEARMIASWTNSEADIAPLSAAHSRVEPSTSMNRNVTVPEGNTRANFDPSISVMSPQRESYEHRVPATRSPRVRVIHSAMPR